MKQIKDKIFIDTNILIYLYSEDELRKRAIVEKLLNPSINACISTQVINEFVNVMHKKKGVSFKHLMSSVKELEEFFLIVYLDTLVINKALSIAQRYGFSYYDCLILASALNHECAKVYTEDMKDGQIIENSLTIVNPFSS
jgi:predicted nucleic acid-binding protein